ncbi:class I SAM-dependent methyltransferase [Thiosulfativibrio zosterae]|uniref:SAM-dependent methyltransferase n=1 Tax=Thiosulfativibrio zosterae TaxID=2675053 RepID=A0A6F8PQK4_9GAMM|nr:class I SAM-dependent methyltransferase [Thiosulfativibrio zosterae]BBP44270.1 SAM-dependent methyltransferase [Thiosulfativibrio zosterae]
MTQSLAQKWDDKYANLDPKRPVLPCWLLKHHSRRLPLKGKALDLACGLGGNARFMAQCGLSVEAWDISDNALTILNNWAAINRLKIKPMLCDFEQMLFPYQQFDVIVVSRYLNRELFAQIETALKPGGMLFYQTFLSPVQENAPQNPKFYLKPTEFNQAWSNLTTEIYGEGWLKDTPDTEDASISQHRYAWYVGKKALL